MSNAELVSRLHAAVSGLVKDYGYNDNPENIIKTITDAITALSAQDDVRDSALEEAAVALDRQWPGPAAEIVRALKSKPAAPVVEDNPTPPAQEAPQSLTEWPRTPVDEWAAYRLGIDWERPATMLDLKIAMLAVGDALDRQGAK